MRYMPPARSWSVLPSCRTSTTQPGESLRFHGAEQLVNLLGVADGLRQGPAPSESDDSEKQEQNERVLHDRSLWLQRYVLD